MHRVVNWEDIRTSLHEVRDIASHVGVGKPRLVGLFKHKILHICHVFEPADRTLNLLICCAEFLDKCIDCGETDSDADSTEHFCCTAFDTVDCVIYLCNAALVDLKADLVDKFCDGQSRFPPFSIGLCSTKTIEQSP